MSTEDFPQIRYADYYNICRQYYVTKKKEGRQIEMTLTVVETEIVSFFNTRSRT